MPTSGQPPAPRVRLSVEAKAVFELEDSRYLDGTATVDEHMIHAIQQAGHWEWFVKRSPTSEAERIDVSTKILAVTIIPREGE
jgi:hypothetical protein